VSRITDVAQKAGVSTSTVSNVLNGRSDRMAAETLARVEAAIRELKYRPNTSARQLKTGYTPLLGLLVPSMANPMYGFIAREIETLAQERYGFRIMIGNTYRDAEKEQHFFEDLMAHGVRGVIIISSLVDEQHVEAAAERGLVVVSYDRRATRIGHAFGDRPRDGRQLRVVAHRDRAFDRARAPAPRLRHALGPHHEPEREDQRLSGRREKRRPPSAARRSSRACRSTSTAIR
jgi:transcriptional regulator with XRE-family HTH domain